jgi:RNA polymerase sigma factor (sigma-70 family)
LPGSEAEDRDFVGFFDSVWPRALAVGRRMGLGHAEAEDVALDATALAHDRWGRVGRLEYREAWTLKVTARLAWRVTRRHQAPAVEQSEVASTEDLALWTVALEAALRQLSRRQRQVVVLRYLADLTEAEVARMLRIDVGSVKRHASRARRTLRGALGGLDGEETG